MYADDTNVTFSAATVPDLDNSDSTILKCLKFLTKLLGQTILYSATIIKVWLDKTFVYFNCSVH